MIALAYEYSTSDHHYVEALAHARKSKEVLVAKREQLEGVEGRTEADEAELKDLEAVIGELDNKVTSFPFFFSTSLYNLDWALHRSKTSSPLRKSKPKPNRINVSMKLWVINFYPPPPRCTIWVRWGWSRNAKLRRSLPSRVQHRGRGLRRAQRKMGRSKRGSVSGSSSRPKSKIWTSNYTLPGIQREHLRQSRRRPHHQSGDDYLDQLYAINKICAKQALYDSIL